MPYRGRLIFPFLARISRLDPDGTASDPDGTGDLTSGYDDVFREPQKIPDGTQTGLDARLYLEPIDIPCQIEDEVWEVLTTMRTGDSPRTEVTLVFHMRDLENAGYVDSTTRDVNTPRKGDRLDSFHRHPDGTLEMTIPEPGLYVTHAQPRSFGLGGKRLNLYVVTFRSRETSVRA